MFHSLKRTTTRFVALITAIVTLFAVISTARTTAQTPGTGPLAQAFASAAQEFDVPRDLLVTIAYAETHFDDHTGAPSVDNGFGLMHLVDTPAVQTLGQAARLLAVPTQTLRTDSVANIRGGAALLRSYADDDGLSAAMRRDVAEWFPVVARYSEATDRRLARDYADEVYRLLNSGLSGQTPAGEVIVVQAQAIEPKQGPYAGLLGAQAASPDYPGALWVAAHATNYMAASRQQDYPIRYIVIHTTQGSYTSAINWFAVDHGSYAPTSANYVIRSRDGQITQTVREKDIAYHAGNWPYNTQSIGIEHEGYVASPTTWYTDMMYRASAALTRSIALKYGIPLDRSHIIGHSEVPGATHTDPGNGWNWTYYMQLVRQAPQSPTPTPGSVPMPHTLYLPAVLAADAWSIVVDNAGATTGFTASSNWDTATFNTQRYGTDYRVTSPQSITDTAWFKATLPAAGRYEVLVWYPASSAYNSATPIVIRTATGEQVVRVNQQTNGGRWVSLGTFSMNGGAGNVVGVSRWSTATGYVVADAVKLVRR